MRMLFYACALSSLLVLALLLSPTCAPQQDGRALRHVSNQQR